MNHSKILTFSHSHILKSDLGIARADLTLALATFALGIVLLSGISQIGVGAGYDRIGPRAFPYAVAAGLILLGSSLGLSALRRSAARHETIPTPVATSRSIWTPLALGLALLLYGPLLESAGFVVATSAQFWLVAFAFRSRRPFRDAIVAVLVSTIVDLIFSRGLGVALP